MILPGTELWKKAAALQLEFDPEPPYFVRSHFSMTATEIVETGAKIAGAILALRGLETIRFLSREPGVTFADLVDAYIAWPGDDLLPFISAFCDQHDIPPAFYEAFASRELRSDRTAAASQLSNSRK
jgi:hypothetical protein